MGVCGGHTRVIICALSTGPRRGLEPQMVKKHTGYKGKVKSFSSLLFLDSIPKSKSGGIWSQEDRICFPLAK